MKGLLLKDFISMKRQLKVTILIVLLYAVLAIIQRSFAYLSGMVALLSIMLPITSLAYDEAAKWDKYALSMPISRKDLVWSKYCLGILSGLVGTLLSILASLCFLLPQKTITLGETLLTAFTVLECSMIILSIIMPILFRYGVEKGRILLMAVVCLPILIGFLWNNAGMAMPSAQTLQLIGIVLPFLVIGIFFASVQISIRIVSQKEL